ncbi:MDR family MFS transporter [Paenibacillus physcomitrellae]|uniref:MFS-type drug efflux transporter P55 n=1 Tax=Paenibacillus physcomitrellae TaxID=1619311 RepID=A0ABQ1GF67_9BACL|nr:MDR family MFS transporter [Paenibacillus physcomitrellae]GGA42385.1 MFS transporter [Paenibacillus physcomitrellae]
MTALGKTNNKKLILIGLLIGLIFSELDETVVSTAMPTIIRDLHGLSLYGWVAGLYMLTATIFMPVLGKLADIYGRKIIYLSCMGLFITGSIVCGLAPSMTVLLVGRGLQGIGAGGLMPLAMVILGDSYPLEQRAKIQSLIGPMMILPQLLGPTVGGFLAGHVNWHWVFLINIPVGLLAALVLSIGMRESRGDERKPIDWGGAALLTGSLLSFLMAPVLVDNQGLSWSSPWMIGLLVLGALLLALFIFVETKTKEPIIPLHLFRIRSVVVLSLIVFTLMLGLMGGISTFPFFAQNVMGLTPTASGYLTLAFMAGAIPSSIINGFMITKLPYRNLFIVCFILPIIGIALLTQLGVHTSVLYVVISFFTLGLGIGVLFGSDNLIVQESVPKQHSGVAVSTIGLVQSLGATIGLSVFGSLLARHIKEGVAGYAGDLPAGATENIASGGIPAGIPADLLLNIREVFVGAFQNLFVIALVFSIIAFIMCWFLGKGVLSKQSEEVEGNAADGEGKSAGAVSMKG